MLLIVKAYLPFPGEVASSAGFGWLKFWLNLTCFQSDELALRLVITPVCTYTCSLTFINPRLPLETSTVIVIVSVSVGNGLLTVSNCDCRLRKRKEQKMLTRYRMSDFFINATHAQHRAPLCPLRLNLHMHLNELR